MLADFFQTTIRFLVLGEKKELSRVPPYLENRGGKLRNSRE